MEEGETWRLGDKERLVGDFFSLSPLLRVSLSCI
jgi:hypothetical protein